MSAPTFGPRLRELREAAGLTQDALALKIGGGVNQGRVGAWERAEIRPTPRTALRIAAALDVPLRDLAPDLADLAFPDGTILLRQVGVGKDRYRPASAEHAAKLRAIGWDEPEIGPRRLVPLLALAAERGRTIAFNPAR